MGQEKEIMFRNVTYCSDVDTYPETPYNYKKYVQKYLKIVLTKVKQRCNDYDEK